MAKRLSINSQEIQLVLVGPRDKFKAPRVQRITLGSDVPSTLVSEIGNRNHVGESKDTANVTLSFSAFDTGIKAFATLTGKDPNAYPSTGANISEIADVDAILYIKSDTSEDYSKSIHARRLKIRDFSFSYSVDGEATEDYNAIGSTKRLLRYDVIVDKFTTGTNSFTLSQTPIQLKNGNYALSVILDGAYLTETSSAPATGEYRIVGTTLTTGDTRTNQCIAIYHANPAGNNWADVSDTSIPASIRGRDIKIRLAANNIARVQSVTINGNLNPTTIRELGNRDVVGYRNQTPTIEGTITVLDTDTELVNLFMYGTTTISGYEWQVGENCAPSGLSLSVQLLDPCDDTVPYTVLKEIYLDQISATGDSTSISVNGDVQLQIPWRSLTGNMVVYSGARP